MDISSTNKELSIVETESPFSSCEIQFVPFDYSNSRQAKMQDVVIVGNNDDLSHYISGSESLKLTLEFYGPGQEVYDRINWLKSMTANDGYAGKFRSVKLVFGDLFKYSVWDIRSVSVKGSQLAQADAWLPQRAKVDIELRLSPGKNRYIQDIRDGK